MSELTLINYNQFTNYTSIQVLQEIIIRTIARWFDIHGAVWTELECFDGVYKLSGIDRLQAHFELFEVREHLYQLTMHAVGRFRRHGSSCDYFEKVFDCLSVQILNPDREFAKMNDCLAIAYPPMNFDFLEPVNTIFESPVPITGSLAEMVVYSEEEDEDSEEEEDEDSEAEDEDEESDSEILLRDMTDKHIDRYIDMLGREPREEVDEWTLDFRGGAIPRYSYVNFADAWITDQCVSNVAIRRARFGRCTLRNFQFEQVHFHECDFKSVILENVTFKDCQFTDCELESNTTDILDNSCSVENFDLEYEDA
jgi:hypothetical protein